jgi:hypothetical protein
MNYFNLQINTKILGLFLILAAIPVGYAAIYNGGYLPATIMNNDTNSTVNGNLIALQDSAGPTGLETCFDNDKGVKALTPGKVSFQDGNSSFVTYVDRCNPAKPGVLIEFACTKDIKVNGVQYVKYVAAFDVNCSQFGLGCVDINATDSKCA